MEDYRDGGADDITTQLMGLYSEVNKAYGEIDDLGEGVVNCNGKL